MAYLDVESGQPSRSFNAVLMCAIAGLGYFTEVSVRKILPGLDCGLTFQASHSSLLNHFADSLMGKFFFQETVLLKLLILQCIYCYNNKNVNSVQLSITITTDRRSPCIEN
jgi:hypothetical protein